MKKYDCNKTLDYAHELNRMCEAYECDGCPLGMITNCNDAMSLSKNINIVQKWSDEHPEAPKLSKREFDFLMMFKWIDGKWIERTPSGRLRFVTKNECCDLCDAWFSFIGKGESMTFEELLKLEVEDE